MKTAVAAAEVATTAAAVTEAAATTMTATEAATGAAATAATTRERYACSLTGALPWWTRPAPSCPSWRRTS